MTLRKKILIGLGIFSIVLLITAVLAPFFIDINTFKPKIEKTLSEYLNAKVEIGKLELSILKGLGADIQGIKISNPPGFPEAPFLEVEHASIYLGALRSLFGSPKVTVTLTKPKIQIYENNQKELSVTKLLKPQPKPKETTPPKDTSLRAQLPKGMLGSLIIRGKAFLEIEDGEFTYFQADGTTSKLQTIDLEVGPLTVFDPISLKLKAFLAPLTKNNMTAQGPLDFKLKISNPLFSKEKITLELISQLNDFQWVTPWIKKSPGQKLNLKVNGSYTQNQVTLETILLEYPLGALNLKGTLSDLKKVSFNTQATLSIVTQQKKEQKDNKPLPYESDVSLEVNAKGTFLPFLIEEANGKVDIKKLSGEIPSFIKPWLDNKKIPLSGQGRLKGNGSFHIQNNKPSRIECDTAEIEWSPSKDQTKDQTMIVKLKGTFENKEEPSLNLYLATNTFSSDIFKPYLTALPLSFKGKISLPEISITGNPQDLSKLNISGKILAQEGTLELTPKLLKGTPWALTGPMVFSTEALFEISQKQLLSLELSTHADLTATTLQFEKQFLKPPHIKCLLDLQADLKKDVFSISKLSFIFHNLSTTLQGSLSPFSSDTKFCQFTLNTDPFSLSEWNQFFPTIQNKFNGEAEIKNLRLSFPVKNPKDFSFSGIFNLNQVTGEIPEKLLQTQAFQMQGPFLLNLKSDIEYANKKIKKLDVTGDVNLTETQLTLPQVFNKQSKVPLQLELKIQSKEDALTIEKAKFTLKDLIFDITGQAIHLSQKPNYTLHFITSSILFQDLAEFLPKLKDSGLSGNARMEADFKGILSESTEPLALGFNVTSTTLDYNPPPAKTDSEKPKPQNTAPPSSTENPTLKRLTVNGQLKVTKASYKTYKFWNIEAPLHYKNKHLTIDPFKFDLYDGKFKASTHIDFNKKDPLTQVETSLQGFNLEKFFISQKSKLSEKLTGTLEANLKFSLSGLEGEKIKHTIAGNGKAIVKNGYFKVFNLTEALSGIPILSKVAPGFELSDDFDFLQSTLIIKDQKLITPDILLKGRSHLLKCQGTFGFATAMDGSLDYRGSYYLAKVEDIRKEIPFTVGGTVSKPKASVNAGKLLQNSVQDIFEQILTPKGQSAPPEEKDKEPEPEEEKPEPKSGNLIEDVLEGTTP